MHGESDVANGASETTAPRHEVFSGFFKDLGMQAMAMESILRLVCGKVDTLEQWMTEMSFGMTEFDLKLRNIAHNIEGTAANVDDEMSGNRRWAAPPQDDMRAMKTSATIVKKVGPRQRAMRVSGMVAGVLDQLEAESLVPKGTRNNEPSSREDSDASGAGRASRRKTRKSRNSTVKSPSRKESSPPSPARQPASDSHASNEHEQQEVPAEASCIASPSEPEHAAAANNSLEAVRELPVDPASSIPPSNDATSTESDLSRVQVQESESHPDSQLGADATNHNPPETSEGAAPNIPSDAASSEPQRQEEEAVVSSADPQITPTSVDPEPADAPDTTASTAGSAMAATSVESLSSASPVAEPAQTSDPSPKPSHNGVWKSMMITKATRPNLTSSSPTAATSRAHDGANDTTDPPIRDPPLEPHPVQPGDSRRPSETSSGDSDDNFSDSDSAESMLDLGGTDDQSEDAALKSSDRRLALRMAHTLSAVKNLQKANMLTPEEAAEMKQRAHQKWFKLREHLKKKNKRDVANILLTRKKDAFTVTRRLELLEDKSREVFASIKQFNSDLKLKVDVVTIDGVRRHLRDMQVSLQAFGQKLSEDNAPAIKLTKQLAKEVETMRAAIQQQIIMVGGQAATNHQQTIQALEQLDLRAASLEHSFQQRLSAVQQAMNDKLTALPDYTEDLDGIRQTLRRKADLKMLRELEARFLEQHDNDEEVLVRCMSCHKEVPSGSHELDVSDDDDVDSTAAPYLRKVSPGPSSGRVYRSNVPLNAAPLAPTGSAPDLFSISEEADNSSDKEHMSPIRLPSASPSKTNSRKEAKPSPLSVVNVTATRVSYSPDRPISAPVRTTKKLTPKRLDLASAPSNT